MELPLHVVRRAVAQDDRMRMGQMSRMGLMGAAVTSQGFLLWGQDTSEQQFWPFSIFRRSSVLEGLCPRQIILGVGIIGSYPQSLLKLLHRCGCLSSLV